MATPKLDKISVELSRRIADPVASAGTNGEVLTATDRTSYINKAMFKLINDYWIQFGGDVKRFAQMFPELIAFEEITLNANGQYDINASSDIRDFFELVDAYNYADVIYIAKVPNYLFNIVVTGDNPDYTADENEPLCINLEGVLYFFPSANYAGAIVRIIYLKLPVDPTNGNLLTQGGTYDIPFYDHWNSTIASIAEQLWRIDAQEDA